MSEVLHGEASGGRFILNSIPIDNVSMTTALDLVQGAVRAEDEVAMFFVNADCINISARNEEYRSVLRGEKTRVFADGIGIRLAGKIMDHPIVDNVNGTDLFPLLCERCAEVGQSLFLLGAQPGVAAEVKRRMEHRYPKLRIVGTHHGYFPHDDCQDVIDEINASGADILLVAFGAPLQEAWIHRYRDQLRPSVKMGVGGLFDFFSGRIRRAPLWVRKLSMEWCWRLAMEPRRMWRRYLVGNVAFMIRVARWQGETKRASN